MTFKEMREKTGIAVVGIVNAHNEFISDEKKAYHSVDLIIKDQKNMLTVSLPEDYPREKLVEGELAQVKVRVKIFNGKTSFQAV